MKARCSEKPWPHLFLHVGARKGYCKMSPGLKQLNSGAHDGSFVFPSISTKTWRWVKGHMSRQEYRAEPIPTDLEGHPGTPQVQGQWQREKAPIRKASFHCGSRLELVKYDCGQKDCHYLTLFFKMSVRPSYAVREDNRKIIKKRIFFYLVWCRE